MPAEAIKNLDGALEAWGGKYKSEIYDGAYHGGRFRVRRFITILRRSARLKS